MSGSGSFSASDIVVVVDGVFVVGREVEDCVVVGCVVVGCAVVGFMVVVVITGSPSKGLIAVDGGRAHSG